MDFPTFDELLDRVFYCDSEVFAHDTLFVFISHKTQERFVFHNATCDEYQNFIDEYNPILITYNGKSYDKYILKACLLGYSPEETKEINDFIIGGNNGWEYPFQGYCEMPPLWDLFDCIKTFKSLKEIEGNLRMDITETTIPFDLPDKWNKQQFEEVLYYCTMDVKALIPLFKRLLNNYKAKYTICKLGKIDPQKGLGMTDANLTATLLKAERHDYDDAFLYTYPSVIDKKKIPQEVLDYIDDLIAHNDLNYKREAPSVKYDDCIVQLGVGGCHGAKETTFIYNRGDVLMCKINVVN